MLHPQLIDFHEKMDTILIATTISHDARSDEERVIGAGIDRKNNMEIAIFGKVVTDGDVGEPRAGGFNG